jgi:regulator of RNase E activity RraA
VCKVPPYTLIPGWVVHGCESRPCIIKCGGSAAAAGRAVAADYQSLAASPKANADLLDLARERLDRTEALKARIMAKIERLEDTMLGQD